MHKGLIALPGFKAGEIDGEPDLIGQVAGIKSDVAGLIGKGQGLTAYPVQLLLHRRLSCRCRDDLSHR